MCGLGAFSNRSCRTPAATPITSVLDLLLLFLSRELHPAAQRILLAEQTAGEWFVDDDHGWCVYGRFLSRREGSPAQQRQLQRLEIVGCDNGERGLNARCPLAFGSWRCSGVLNHLAGLELAERHDRGETRRRDARCAADLPQDVCERQPATRLVVAAQCRVDGGDQAAFEREPGIGHARLDRPAHEEASRCQKRQGQGDLTDHEQVPDRKTAASAEVGELFLEIGQHVRSGDAPGRAKTGNDRGNHREPHGCGEDTDIRCDIDGDDHWEHRFECRGEQPRAPHREKQAGRATEGREQQTLGQQQANEPASSASQRQSDGDFLPADGPPCQQHVREIQARDQQNEPRHAHQQHRQCAQLGVVPWIGAHGEPRQFLHHQLVVSLICRIGLTQLLGEDREARACSLVGESVPQLADDHQGAIVRIGKTRTIGTGEYLVRGDAVDADGEPEFRRDERHRAGEALRRHADDREVVAVEPRRASDHIRRGYPGASRKLVSDDHGLDVAVGPLLFLGERPARGQAHPQRREIVSRDDGRERSACCVPLRRTEHRHGECERIGKHLTALAYQLVFLPGEGAIVVWTRSVLGVDPDDPAAVRCDGLEHHRVHEAEDRRIGPDAQREDEDSDSRKPRVLSQEPGGESQVAEDALHAGVYGAYGE